MKLFVSLFIILDSSGFCLLAPVFLSNWFQFSKRKTALNRKMSLTIFKTAKVPLFVVLRKPGGFLFISKS
jgi:hypothetical protein